MDIEKQLDNVHCNNEIYKTMNELANGEMNKEHWNHISLLSFKLDKYQCLCNCEVDLNSAFGEMMITLINRGKISF